VEGGERVTASPAPAPSDSGRPAFAGTSTSSAARFVLPKARWAVVLFPGSNCDMDCVHALRDVLKQDVETVWHTQAVPDHRQCIVLPGGFSYGDYLRTGILAARSRVMDSVREHAERGTLVLGICNGFQVLCESGLLPGVLMKNTSLRFRCREAHLRVERADRPFTRGTLRQGQTIRLPIAHGFGNYYASPDQLREMEAKGQVLFRYANARGEVNDASNPNGSLGNIAGITNSRGNVLGLMPHPERACEALLGGIDGKRLFESMAMTVAVANAAYKPAS